MSAEQRTLSFWLGQIPPGSANVALRLPLAVAHNEGAALLLAVIGLVHQTRQQHVGIQSTGGERL